MGIIDWFLRKTKVVKAPEKEIDINADLRAVINFLTDINYDSQRLLRMFRELQNIRREYRVLQDEEMKKKNIAKQVNLFDEILDYYHYFEDDADINGIRVKNIAKILKSAIEKIGDPKLIKKTKDVKWSANW